MCLTSQDLSRLGRPVPAPPSPESEYIPAVDSRWVLLSTDRCAAQCRENLPSPHLSIKVASMHLYYLQFFEILGPRIVTPVTTGTTIGNRRWAQILSRLYILSFMAFEKLNTIYFATL